MSAVTCTVGRVNSDTCSALTAVFPLILVTVTLQRRDMHVNIRRLRMTRVVLMGSVAVCLIGLLTTLIGIEIGGLAGIAAALAWTLLALAVIGLGFVVLAIHATLEGEEDGPKRIQIF